MGTADRTQLILIFAPIGRDGPAAAEVLRAMKFDVMICRDFQEFIREMEAGAAVVFLAEEGIFGQDITPLIRCVDEQPPWSDLPLIVLTSHQEQPAVMQWRRRLVAALHNVSLLERPVHPMTLTSAVQSAMRARRRQYEVQALLKSREDAAQQLEGLVAERTSALEQANNQLRVEMAERARVEEALRQAQKLEAIGQLTGGIAHDFNNLLMVISGGLDMIDHQKDPARRHRLKAGMLQAAERGARLTRQLLAFSRRQELRPEPVDLARHIGAMRDLLDRSLRGDVHMAFDFPRSLWPVEVDPGEFELVVLNLAVNARDAMPKGGTIVMRGENRADIEDGELRGDYVRLTVIDTGVGMPPEIQARVFEPFFTTKEIGKGSGLGLPQVYGFAKQSGGAVRIASEVGLGTEISLYLPRSHKMPSEDRYRFVSSGAEPPEAQGRGNVLLVEDDDEVATLVGEMLDQLGYRVTRAASGLAALGALADNRRVDLVFSDIMMPGEMDGVELAREIRRRRRDLPVLLTTGYPQAAAEAAGESGVRILPKPYRIDELAAALRAATDRMVRASPMR